MGNARWDSAQFTATVSAPAAGKTRAQVFSSRGMPPEFDPRSIKVRESRDSAANPRSRAISMFCDVTGSMGEVAEDMVRGKLDTTMRELYARLSGCDPHVMVGAVGDAYSDEAPLQATQYEAGATVLGDQLKRVWLEGNGGGNGGESYSGAHYFLGTRTSLDCFERRGVKGIAFTMGDEPVHDGLTKDQVSKVFGDAVERRLDARQCLEMATRSFEVFHIVLAGVGVAQRDLGRVMASWTPLLGERVLVLDDHKAVAELVVSTCQVLQGHDPNAVAASWGGRTAGSIGRALAPLAGKAVAARGAGGGAVRFAR